MYHKKLRRLNAQLRAWNLVKMRIQVPLWMLALETHEQSDIGEDWYQDDVDMLDSESNSEVGILSEEESSDLK